METYTVTYTLTESQDKTLRNLASLYGIAPEELFATIMTANSRWFINDKLELCLAAEKHRKARKGSMMIN